MSRLNKQLSLLQGTGLLTTSLLGTGIFVVPALAATIAGAASLWAWLLLILMVLPIALTFAQLGKRFPHAGGAPYLIGRAFGGPWERSVAWLFLAVIPVGLPAALHIATGFWKALIELTPGQELAIQLATLGAMLLLGQRPARASGLVQTAIAVLILATVAALWWRGGLPLPSQSLLPLAEAQGGALAWQQIPPALAVMFWCFVGIEAFTHMGEEFRNPQRDFPLAVLSGVLLAGLVYWGCAVAVVSFGTYGDASTDASSLPRLIALLWSDELRWLAALIGYLACFATINIYLQGFARLLWSLAQEGKLPAGLAQLNRNQVPARALALVIGCCALCATLAWWQAVPVDQLIRYANGNFILVYLLSMAAGWVLLRGLWRLLAGIGVLLCVLTCVTLGSQAFYALGLLALCLWWERRRPLGQLHRV